MTFSLASLGPADAEPTARTLTDFGSESAITWTTVNDNVMGGRSQGGFRVSEGVLRFEGATNTNGGGFSSIRSRPVRLDLSAYEGVRLRVRADGRRYTFRLTTSTSRSGRYAPSYWADFETEKGTEWQVVDVPFSSFRPRWRGSNLSGPALDLAHVDSLGLMIYDKKDGAFRLDVDWIQAYQRAPAFSLAAFRGAKRPLVVFAPRSDDARLARQLESVLADEKGFEERDMLLVVVPANGRAKAGTRVLSDTDAELLRKSFGIASDAFAVRLVGKDGGVKRSAEVMIPAADLFKQIDAMPMRQAEMRRGTSR
jgi:NADH dehydrogenase [ubiquinone] 1 alpha subcomplex assembly factor 1